MGNFYTIHAASKILGVTPQTLRNWDKTGKLKPHHTSANGYRHYSQEQIDAFLRVAKKTTASTFTCPIVSGISRKKTAFPRFFRLFG